MGVMRCHQQEGQSQRTPSNPGLASGWMQKRNNGLKSIVSGTMSQRERLFAGEFTCFWRKNKTTGTPWKANPDCLISPPEGG